MRQLARSLLCVGLVAALITTRPAPASATDKDTPMNVEPLRILSDWLNDPSNGLNAKLAALPHTGYAAPPSVALIAAEIDNGIVARDRLPSGTPGPVLTISCIEESVWTTALEDNYRDCEHFPVQFRYGDLVEVATEEGIRNGYYTIRALLRSIKTLMSPDTPPASRTRDSIELVNTTDLVRIHPSMKQVEDRIVFVSVSLSFGVRDNAP